MLFIPFGADCIHRRIPVITILISLLCLAIYYNQHTNQQQVITASEQFCDQQGSTMWRMVLKSTSTKASAATCLEMMWKIHLEDNPKNIIRNYANQGKAIAGINKEADSDLKYQVIEQRYKEFKTSVPLYDTQQLWYEPASWDYADMITAAFAHGSWMHVIGNLFFFFAFAVTLEMILGSIVFSAVILSLAVGTHIFYSLAMMGVPDAMPTVGLSGVVMGVMAMFTFFLPAGKIKCFFWFLIIFRVFKIPAWLLVGWYIGWDVYDLLVVSDDRSGINLIAHVSGAGIGYLMGVVFFRGKRINVRNDVAFV